MYISKLTIKNYRNFSHFDINLKPFTLIIGENNIGKTNLLNAIGLIFSQDITFFKKRFLEVDDIHFKSIRDLKENIVNGVFIDKILYPEVIVEVILTDFDLDQEAVVGDWIIDNEFKEAKLTYKFSPRVNFDKGKEIANQRKILEEYIKEKGQEVYDKLSIEEKITLINFPLNQYEYNIFGGIDVTQRVDYYHLNMLKFEFLDALRDAKNELIASRDNKLLYRILNSKSESDYSELRAEINGLQKKVEVNPALKSLKVQISINLEKISIEDGLNNKVDFLFSLPEVSELLKKLSLIYGDSPIKIERNGTGRNNLLYISLMLSYINNDEYSNKNYFRLVAIEEPESHLHPNIQDHLAKNIESMLRNSGGEKRKDIQLIVTSHSTHISTKLELDNTVILFNNSGKIDNHYILEGFDDNAKSKKEIRFLRKYLDAVNSTMFYSRKIMLVEGISEKLLFPKFFELTYKKSLEKSHCTILNVNGLAFRNFLEIIKNGYFIKCAVFTDSDTGTVTENRAENLINEYKVHSQILIEKTEESTFEKDVIKANTTGKGKEILLNALTAVRPLNGKALKTKLGNAPLIAEDFFNEIENYKSEFAFHLTAELEENSDGFVIPSYIISGFNFINRG